MDNPTQTPGSGANAPESYNPAEDSLESPANATPITEESSAQKPKRRPPALSKRTAIIAGVATLLIILGAVIIALTRPDKPKQLPETAGAGQTQTISTETLKKVLVNGAGTGEVQQVTISPKTLFLNDVTVQGNVSLSKNLSVKGTADIQGATVLGSSLAVRGPLTVSGSANFGGNLNVSGTIVTGGLSVGSLSVANATITNNLTLGGHIIPNGAKPTGTPSVAAGGGSISISGNDTAGTITISTGGSPIAGEMAIITFRTAFGGTPKVQLTPINASSAQLQYYASRSASFFTINTANAPVANNSYTYDYLVTQ